MNIFGSFIGDVVNYCDPLFVILEHRGEPFVGPAGNY